MNNQELGQLGERLTCEYLVNNGYNILGKNHRITFGRHKTAPAFDGHNSTSAFDRYNSTPVFGEIDIIARKKWRLFRKNDKTIHFVEVKTILGEKDFFPEEKVDSRKQRKLRKLAQIWLNTNGFKENFPYQIDVAGITVNPKTNMARLFYFFNAVGD